MVRKHTFEMKEEIVVKAADFVFNYENVELFSKNYKIDNKIIGRGN